MHTYMYICIHLCVNIFIHTHTQIHKHTLSLSFSLSLSLSLPHTHTHKRTHTHTHTHTQGLLIYGLRQVGAIVFRFLNDKENWKDHNQYARAFYSKVCTQILFSFSIDMQDHNQYERAHGLFIQWALCADTSLSSV